MSSARKTFEANIIITVSCVQENAIISDDEMMEAAGVVEQAINDMRYIGRKNDLDYSVRLHIGGEVK